MIFHQYSCDTTDSLQLPIPFILSLAVTTSLLRLELVWSALLPFTSAGHLTVATMVSQPPYARPNGFTTT